MCLNAIRPVLQPDSKLSKMISFGRIILVINIIVSLLRLFTGNPGDMLYDLICAVFLLMAVFSFYFLYMAFYVMFSLLSTVYLLVTIAIYVQVIIMSNKMLGNGDIVVLSITIFILVFYIFAIIFTFPMYKEMKAQFVGANSNANQSSQSDAERPNTDANANRSGFAAFSGRGVALGGN
jgi:hypothetical protein